MKQTIQSLLLFFFAVTVSLHADEQVIRGRYYLEGTYADSFFSPTKPYKIRDGLMDKENNFQNRGEVFGPYTAAYGTDLEKLVSWYAFEKAPKGKIDSQSQSLFFEYVFQSGIGLGLGLNQTNFQGNDLSKTKFDSMFELGYLSRLNPDFQGYPISQLIQYEILLPNVTFSDHDFLHIRYANLQLAYHFLENSMFDPYIRIGAGIGKERYYKATILQSNLTIGTRIFLSERFYLVLEAVGNNYDARKEVQSPNLTSFNRKKEDHIWSLQEYSAKIGVGIQF
ncbi:outer membrane beta-barrel protein [Leptospira sp. WS39.C2]